MNGHVTFVSSGPGDPDLLTVKAARILGQASVVLFDDLSAGAILDLVPKDAELVGVGKRAGRPSPKQDHINRLLLDYAGTGQQVVRLKSGDASVFGRLEEEIQALKDAGISYDIVPGVPAAMAAAAAAGIPLTRRALAKRVQFVTGHDALGTLPEDLNWTALADARTTTVVYMGKGTFPKLANALLERGLPPETPALLAENVSHSNQNIIRANVQQLADRLASEKGEGPAIILYGPLAEFD